jgi:integrase
MLQQHLVACDVHALALKGITLQTRSAQYSFLVSFSRLPPRFHTMSVARATLTFLDEGRLQRNLSWVTMAQKVGTVAAAFSRLHQIENAHSNPILQILLILMWACAGRPGDILQLERGHVQVHEARHGAPTKLSVLFTRGKVLKMVDPYTIHTAIPEQWAAVLRAHLAQCTTKFLLHAPRKADRDLLFRTARELLRQVNSKYDLKAIRRGAAQTLARGGVPLPTILLFTRHTTLTTLRRYLGFGQTKSEEATVAMNAASALWPSRC